MQQEDKMFNPDWQKSHVEFYKEQNISGGIYRRAPIYDVFFLCRYTIYLLVLVVIASFGAILYIILQDDPNSAFNIEVNSEDVFRAAMTFAAVTHPSI